MKRIRFFPTLGFILLPSLAWAFPEMVRHGYMNCIACHTSNSGGGLLNEYGRSLSKELLSAPSLGGIPAGEGDEAFLYGFVKPPPKWLLGGDVRVLQTFVDSKQAARGRFMIMQADVEASYQPDSHWRIFGAVGRIEPRVAQAQAKDFVASPRHGVEYVFTKPDALERFSVRAGRFMPAYGIGFAEHPFVTRQYLDFGPALERYALEASWLNERFSASSSVIFAQADGNWNRPEKGAILNIAAAVREKSKLGLNYYQSQRESALHQNYTRRSLGLYAHLALDKDWYALLEADRFLGEAGTWGFMDVLKIGYEIQSGLHLIGVQEYANRNASEPNPRFESFSLGAEWFPRPHWDLYALYRKQRDTAVANDFADVVWLIGHFYL